MRVEESTVDFWKSMLRVAFGLFVGEAIAVEVYLLGWPDGPHRVALSAMVATSALASTISLLLVPWIARQPWRGHFSLAWTLLAGGALAVSVSLDGGLQSPLLLLMLFPVAYAGLVFRPLAAALCAVVSLIEVVALAIADRETPQGDTFLIAACVITGLGVLTWLSSIHRSRWNRRYVALTRELEVLAATDHLTGCLNHRAFNARVADEIDRALRYGHPLSLVVADVDDFKRVNDTHGHPAGDAALELAGATLRERSRRSDIVGRIGGDEFALLLPEIHLAAAASYAQRVFRPSGTGTNALTFSAGVASLDPAEPTADHLFREADRTLYHVKRNGGRGIAVANAPGAPTSLDLEYGLT
ncbi:MAG TPA: GGDEF domain-containing protein [Ilumatobacteraceae bacterium]|nr:GGDEF domain-containing protein [Ilumatobacteraceae bacterium]